MLAAEHHALAERREVVALILDGVPISRQRAESRLGYRLDQTLPRPSSGASTPPTPASSTASRKPSVMPPAPARSAFWPAQPLGGYRCLDRPHSIRTCSST